MSTQTTTSEQEQGEWVLAQQGTDCIFRWGQIAPAKIVYVDLRLGGSATSAVMRAMRDPANVLNVDAYPEVVAALIDTVALSLPTYTKNPADVLKRAHSALSAVHPAQGDKR